MTQMIGKKQERLSFAYWTRKIKRLKNRQSGPISPAVLKQFLRVCHCPNFHSLWKIFSPATVWKMPSRRHKISGGRTGPHFAQLFPMGFGNCEVFFRPFLEILSLLIGKFFFYLCGHSCHQTTSRNFHSSRH